MKAGDTVLLEDAGELVLVIQYKDGTEYIVGIENEAEGGRIYDEAKRWDEGSIRRAYTATRNN